VWAVCLSNSFFFGQIRSKGFQVFLKIHFSSIAQALLPTYICHVIKSKTFITISFFSGRIKKKGGERRDEISNPVRFNNPLSLL